MVPLTRRQLLQQTVAGGSVLALAGCTAPNVPSLSGGESVPKPFTNDAYHASYTTSGRWLMQGHDGGRTGHAAAAVPHGNVDVAWLRRPGNNPHGATGPIVGPERVYIACVESPDDAEHSETYLAGFDAESGESPPDAFWSLADRFRQQEAVEDRGDGVTGEYLTTYEGQIYGTELTNGDDYNIGKTATTSA